MRDQAEKERTEVLERFQAVKGRLESDQSMIVGFLEKEGKTETDFDEKEAENALRKLTEDLKKSISYKSLFIILNNVSLILSVVGLVLFPLTVSNCILLAVPAITLINSP